MSKKLSKTEIQNISKRLGWKYGQTKDYINKYREKGSILDYEDLIRTCYKSSSPIKRFNNIASLLYNHCKDEVSTIKALVNQDVLIDTIILFNISDFVQDQNIEIITVDKYDTGVSVFVDGKEIIIQEPHTDKATLTQEWFSKTRELIIQDRDWDTEIFATLKEPKHLDNYEPSTSKIFKQHLDQYELAYNLCDSYISRKELYEYTNTRYPFRTFLIIDDLILQLFPTLGFRIFNIEYFRKHISIKSENEYLKEEEQFFRRLRNTVFDINENRNELTNKRYWFYYCLIEKIRSKGYNIKHACRLLENMLDEDSGSLRARYYEMQKKVKKIEKFNLDEFIKQQGFTHKLNEYLGNVKADQK